ncbi:MAG: hypothetical protein HQK57_00500 [Deltaproteobacteria bacterium]|nr:hypothetical protein [Deltaproteobacteria bacterium]
MSTQQKIVVVIFDLLLLAELAFSIYLGRHDREEMAGMFIRTFVPLLVVTVISYRYAMRKLDPPEPATETCPAPDQN